MATLADREKHAIVTLLAQFARPADVVVHMRHHFGIEIDRFQVRSYDPTNPRYEGGARWRPVFEAARAAYLSSIESVPIAHKAYRLNTLQRILGAAMASGNYVFAASILRQAAREAGDAIVARSERNKPPATRYVSPADRTAATAEIVRRTVERMQDRGLVEKVETPVVNLKAA